MSFDRLADFSIDAAINTDFKGTNTAEGMQRNLVNNAMRSLAAMIKADTSAVTPTITAGSTFTLASISTGDYVLMAPPNGLSISSFGPGIPGQFKWLEATGAMVLRNSANLKLQSNADVSLSAGDMVYARCLAANVWRTRIFRGDGRALVADTVFYTGSETTVTPTLLDLFAFKDVSNSNAAQFAEADVLLALLQNYISGLTLSNAADTAHDITIATGAAADSTNAFIMANPSAMTKQLDATWAAGTNAGGLFSGATAVGAGGSYHVHMIRKTSDGSVDFGFDSSATAANKPAGYGNYRRVGSIKLDGSSNIIQFTQYGDDFIWTVPIVDVDATNPGTSAVTRALTVPSGVKFRARFWGGGFTGTSSNLGIFFSSLDQTDTAPQNPATAALTAPVNTSVATSGTAEWRMVELNIWTDTSGQIRSRLSASGVADHIGIITNGWMDLRGK